jgi:UDP:flavonoid glycosyltransferase YjiC (YdhE family)
MNRRFVLFIATGSPGNIRPIIAAARACRVAGIPVMCCTIPLWEHWVRAQGIPWRAISAGVTTLLTGDLRYPDVVHDQGSRSVVTQLRTRLAVARARTIYSNELTQLIADASLIVCHHAHQRVTMHADALGIPCIMVSRYGTPPKSGIQRDCPVLYATSPALSDPAVVQNALQRITGEWLLLEPEALAAPLERFVRVNLPYVVVTHGAFLEAAAQRVVQMAATCVRDLGMRCLILMPADLETVKSDEQTMTWSGPLTHQHVIAGAACVIHPGGAGTTHRVVRAGVPGLAIPLQASDQYWAQRALQVQLSVAVLQPHELTIPVLSDALAHLVTDVSYRHRSRLLATQMAAEHGLDQMLTVVQPYLGVS